MSLEYLCTQKDPFLAMIGPFSQGVSRCATKWEKSGTKVIVGIFFEIFEKLSPKIGKLENGL